jgi:hypothetical protein
MRILLLNAKRRTAAITSACAVIALTACGGHGTHSSTGVASLPASPGQPSASSAGSADNGGPAGLSGVTVPDNAPPAEMDRIFNAWASCMQAHGDHEFYSKRNGDGAIQFPVGNPDSKYPSAVSACAALHPHQPWQEMPQYNPNYNQDFAKWINCLNAKGVPVKATPGGWTYNGTSRLSDAAKQKVEVVCEMQAFNEK